MTVLTDTPADRRQMARSKRLMSMSMEYTTGERSSTTERWSVVTTDVSPSGAFLSIPQTALPPCGASVRLSLAQDHTQIAIDAWVVRQVTRPSSLDRVRGVAVSFRRFKSSEGASALFDCLARISTDAQLVSGAEHMEVADDGSAAYSPPVTAKPLVVAVHSERIAASRAVPNELRTHEQTVESRPAQTNRRRFKRTTTSVELRWFASDEVPNVGRLLNASRSGVFVQTDQDLPAIGREVLVVFSVVDAPGAPQIRLHGRVSRHWDPSTEGLPGFGLRIKRAEEYGGDGSYRMFLRGAHGRTTRRLGFRYNPRR